MKFNYDVLHNFISPVTGRVLADPDYVLVGDSQGIATPSPILIDIRLDLLNLRYDFNVAASASYIIGFPNSQLPNAQVLNSLDDDKMPDGYMYNTEGIVSTLPTIPIGSLELQENYVFRGNSDNIAAQVMTLGLNNMASLANNNIWIGNTMGRPVPQSQINLSNLPDLEQTFLWLGGSNNKAVAVPHIQPGNLPDLPHNKIWVGSLLNRPAISGDYVIPLKIPPILSETIMIWEHIPGSDTYYAASSEVPIVIFAEIEANLIALDAAVLALEEEIIDLQAELLVVEGLIAGIQLEIIAIQAEISALRLNTIPADDDVSIYGYKIINLTDPTNPQDAATKQYVDDTVAEGTDIELTGFVTGGPPVDGVIDTVKTPGDLDMEGYRVLNLQQNPEGDFDAVSTKFLWDLMNDNVEVLYGN